MLSRRSLLASTTVLAAGCSTVGPPFSAPSTPQPVQLNVAAYTLYVHLAAPFGGDTPRESPEAKYQKAVAALEADTENPYGATRGGYRLALRFLEEFYPLGEPKTAEEAEAAHAAALDTVAALLDELDADLVTVWPEEARWLGERGLLLPLDRFSGVDESALNREFYANVFNEFRFEGALYALPIGANPLMLYYDEGHFAEQGVPAVDVSWDWDDLVENAAKLTTRGEDGVVARWGLVAHRHGVWWALWQNDAHVVDMDKLLCRVQEPAAVAALQFVHDLIHTHRVSPPVSRRDLSSLTRRSPPAMLYTYAPQLLNQRGFRMAALPWGKAHAAPVRAGFGLGIAARTQKAEAAYTALRGFTHALQEHVAVPATSAAIARLGEIRTDLRPEEVAALQHSLEHGRAWPHDLLQLYAMSILVEGLVRGDNVTTIVNQACSLVREYQQTGKLP